MKTAIRVLCAGIAVIVSIILGIVLYWMFQLPNAFQVEEGTTLFVNNAIISSQNHETDRAVSSAMEADVGDEYTVTLRWLGVFPIKEVSVSVVEKGAVVLGGIPFGIKLYAEGVMVVSLSAVDTITGGIYPAKHAGMKTGDIILSIDGKTVLTNEEVGELVKQSGGRPMRYHVRRNGVEFDITFSAVKSIKENCYKAGIWVRDSSAGIGTVTFYDPDTKIMAGLGHAVCDVDTGNIIPISSGEIVPARIYGVTKSQVGTPGELRGGFDLGSFGSLCINCESGIYGKVSDFRGNLVPIMLKQEIQSGHAQVYTTVSGNQPQWYDIIISKIRYHDTSGTRSMVIEITDPDLLDITGGIVQGMSGSPIVQNGKLVGAITHVFVNDPTKGYAIFAENMLETAQSVAEGNNLKKVS